MDPFFDPEFSLPQPPAPRDYTEADWQLERTAALRHALEIPATIAQAIARWYPPEPSTGNPS